MSKINTLETISSKYVGTPSKWKEFLTFWEQKRINLNLHHNDRFIWNENCDIDVVKQKIIATENRLGVNLPQSYKDFIIATDGSYIPKWLLNGVYSDFLFPIEKINWLKKLSPQLVYEAYAADPDISVEDEEYYRYDKKQDDYAYRLEYLEYCIKLNTDSGSGEYEILLNQKEQTSDKEFEAWFFYTGEGNVLRYTSFAALIVGLYLLDITQKKSVVILSNNDDPYGYSNLLLSSN